MNEKKRSPEILAVKFVIVAKLLTEIIVNTMALPLKAIVAWLPDMDTPGAPRLSRFKKRFMAHAHTHSPSWAVYNGNFTVLLKTQAGSDLLNRLVDWTPATAIDYWLRFAVKVMAMWFIGWALLLIWGLLLTARLLLRSLVDISLWLVEYDWSSLFQPQQPRGISPKQLLFEIISSIPEIAQFIVAFAAFSALFMAIYWLIMIFLLPGLALHEFGHYAAIRKAGSSVNSYGLLFFGPIPVGAFVEPADDVNDVALGPRLKIWSAGVANSLIFGSALLSCGLLISSAPSQAADVILMQETWNERVNGFVSIILLLGLAEVASSFLNSMPFGMVDGGRFVQSVEREFWGIEKSMGIKQKIMRFVGMVENDES